MATIENAMMPEVVTIPPGLDGRLAVFPVKHRSDGDRDEGEQGEHDIDDVHELPRAPEHVEPVEELGDEQEQSTAGRDQRPVISIQSDLRQIGFRSIGDSNCVIGGIWGG